MRVKLRVRVGHALVLGLTITTMMGLKHDTGPSHVVRTLLAMLWFWSVKAAFRTSAPKSHLSGAFK